MRNNKFRILKPVAILLLFCLVIGAQCEKEAIQDISEEPVIEDESFLECLKKAKEYEEESDEGYSETVKVSSIKQFAPSFDPSLRQNSSVNQAQNCFNLRNISFPYYVYALIFSF